MANDRYLVEKRRPGPRMRPASLSARLSGTKSARAMPLFPRPGGGGYSAHTVRHLIEALAFGVGAAWLEANRGWEHRVTPQVHADAALNHRMSSDKLGYRDLERNRDLWNLRAASGDPENGVPGVLDLLIGDAGARKGWDIEAIREASRRLAIAQRHLEETERLLASRRLERKALAQRSLPAVPRDIASLSVDEVARLHLERDIAREKLTQERDVLDDLIEQAHDECLEADADADAARKRLDRIRERGRTHPIPDAEPTAAELKAVDDDRVALDEETWEQALARAGVSPELLMPDEEEESPLRIRHHLNMPEFAAVLGLTDGALRKRLRGATTPLFPLEGPDTPLVQDPARPKLRFINTRKLPARFLKSLLPEQREMIEQLLAVPMGSTRWGGRRIPAKLAH